MIEYEEIKFHSATIEDNKGSKSELPVQQQESQVSCFHFTTKHAGLVQYFNLWDDGRILE